MVAEIQCLELVPHWGPQVLRVAASPQQGGPPVVPQEDRERAHSRLRAVHQDDDTFVWSLEVREQFTVGSVRWGVVRLHGSWDGDLSISLEELSGAFQGY